jgi:hypothetical protein
MSDQVAKLEEPRQTQVLAELHAAISLVIVARAGSQLVTMGRDHEWIESGHILDVLEMACERLRDSYNRIDPALAPKLLYELDVAISLAVVARAASQLVFGQDDEWIESGHVSVVLETACERLRASFNHIQAVLTSKETLEERGNA